MHESEKWKWSHSVLSDSERPHRLQPTRLLRPWDFPGRSTGVGCHCLLHIALTGLYQFPISATLVPINFKWMLHGEKHRKPKNALPWTKTIRRNIRLVLSLYFFSPFLWRYSTVSSSFIIFCILFLSVFSRISCYHFSFFLCFSGNNLLFHLHLLSFIFFFFFWVSFPESCVITLFFSISLGICHCFFLFIILEFFFWVSFPEALSPSLSISLCHTLFVYSSHHPLPSSKLY